MTWTKLSDDFTDDCWRLSDAAFRVHVEALVWSNRKLLDLVIEVDDLHQLASKSASTAEAVAELVGAGWWEPIDDGFRIIHHGVYQRTAEAVLAQQKANTENGRKGGRPAGPPREKAPRQRSKTHSVSDSLSDSVSDSVLPNDDTKTHSVSEPVDNSPENGLKTHSLTEMETESPSERDGTGLGEVTTYESKEPAMPTTPNWKSKMIPNRKCRVCGNLFTSPDPERFEVCPVQDDAHAAAREVA